MSPKNAERLRQLARMTILFGHFRTFLAVQVKIEAWFAGTVVGPATGEPRTQRLETHMASKLAALTALYLLGGCTHEATEHLDETEGALGVIAPSVPSSARIVGTWQTTHTSASCSEERLSFYRPDSSISLSSGSTRWGTNPAGTWSIVGWVQNRSSAQSSVLFTEGEVAVYLNVTSARLVSGQWELTYTGYQLWRELIASTYSRPSWVPITATVYNNTLTINNGLADTFGCSSPEGNTFSRYSTEPKDLGTGGYGLAAGATYVPSSASSNCSAQEIYMHRVPGGLRIEDGTIHATYGFIGINTYLSTTDATVGVSPASATYYLNYSSTSGTVETYAGYLFDATGSVWGRTSIAWTPITVSFDTSTNTFSQTSNYSACRTTYER